MANVFFDIGQSNNMSRSDREKIIFLEGTDDAYFFDRILEDIGADPNQVGLVTVGGKGEFQSKIKGFKKTPYFTQGKNKGILVIKDADDDFPGSEREMSGLFKNFFDVQVKHGEVVWRNGVAYGFFLMPGIARSGDLEELCLDTVEGAALEKISAEFLNAAQVQPGDQFFKRKAQVYLAGFPGDLCRGAGLGFKKGKFDESNVALAPLKMFLTDFVGEEPVTSEPT